MERISLLVPTGEGLEPSFQSFEFLPEVVEGVNVRTVKIKPKEKSRYEVENCVSEPIGTRPLHYEHE